VLALKKKDGGVVPIIGAPEMGKSVLAYRLAEILDKPTFAVSPEQKPPRWVKSVTLDEALNPIVVPKNSVLILDDILLYASSRDYRDPQVQKLEKLIPVARHQRKIMVIFCTQVSSLTDKNLFMGGIVFLKPPSILFEDTERDGVRKLQKRCEDYWADKSERWIHRHCYVISHAFEGLAKIDMAKARKPIIPSLEEDTLAEVSL
ncbi:unnamed protein product, partial [marine sediment metagenome]